MPFAVVQLAGLALIIWSVHGLDPLELAGIRDAGTRSTLQITGPYHWVRHPLYLGWMLAVFGAAHMTGDRLAFAAISSIYLVFAVPWEEQSLRRAFGEDYETLHAPRPVAHHPFRLLNAGFRNPKSAIRNPQSSAILNSSEAPSADRGSRSRRSARTRPSSRAAP